MKKKGSTRTAAKLLCLLMSVMMSVFAFSGIAMAEEPVKASSWEDLAAKLAAESKPEGESAEHPTEIQLDAEIDISSVSSSYRTLEVENRNIKLDLNGKTLNMSNKKGIIDVKNGSLTITDSAEVKGKIQGGIKTANVGCAIRVSAGGNLVLDGAVIEGDQYASPIKVLGGGACTIKGTTKIVGSAPINVSGGTLVVESGTISSTGSSGIDVLNGGSCEIKGGKIEQTAPPEFIDDTGLSGVSVGKGSQCTITGGEISGQVNGVLVEGADASLTVENGEITGNNFGIWVNDSGDCTIDGGTIKAGESGGVAERGKFGVLIEGGSQCDVKNGNISGLYAGIGINGEGSSLNMTGGTVTGESFGVAGTDEGKVAGETNITITGGSVTGGDALGGGYVGAGVYLPQSGNCTIGDEATGEGPTITGGCGIVQRNGELTVAGGTITANAANNDYTVSTSGVEKVKPSAVVVDSKSVTEGYGDGREVKANVTGGKFNTQDEVGLFTNVNDGENDLTVTGGEFTEEEMNDANAFIPSGTAKLKDKDNNYYVGNKAAEEALQAATEGESFTLESGTLNAAGVPDGTELKVNDGATATVNGITTEGAGDGTTVEVCAHEDCTETPLIPANCFNTGLSLFTCNKAECNGYSWYEVTPITHQKPANEEDIKRIEPDCLNDGSISYTCEKCHQKIEDEKLPATGHDFETEGTIVVEYTEPDCLHGVMTLKKCMNPNCPGFDETPGADNKGATGEQVFEGINDNEPVAVYLWEDESQPATGHTFADYRYKSLPSCTNEGVMIQVCQKPNCPGIDTTPGADIGDEYNITIEGESTEKTKAAQDVPIEKLAHNYGTSWHYNGDEDGCNEAGMDGKHWQKCIVCNTIKEDSKADHEGLAAAKPATCVLAGDKGSGTCTTCGYTPDTEPVPPLNGGNGHKFADLETITKALADNDPTNDQDGYGVTWYWNGDDPTNGYDYESSKPGCKEDVDGKKIVLICQNEGCNGEFATDEGKEYTPDELGRMNGATGKLPGGTAAILTTEEKYHVAHDMPSEALKQQVLAKYVECIAADPFETAEEKFGEYLKTIEEKYRECFIYKNEEGATDPANCQDTKTLLVQCANCDKKVEVQTEVLGEKLQDDKFHTGIETNRVIDEENKPTCQKAGYAVYKCPECGKLRHENADGTGEIKKDDEPASYEYHNFGDDTVMPELRAATCITPQFVTRKCLNPGCNAYDLTHISDNGVKAKGHQWVKEKAAIDVAPTCTADGYIVYKCADPDCPGIIDLAAEQKKYNEDDLKKLYPYYEENGDINDGAIDADAVKELLQQNNFTVADADTKIPKMDGDEIVAYKVVLAKEDASLKATGHEMVEDENTYQYATCMHNAMIPSQHCKHVGCDYTVAAQDAYKLAYQQQVVENKMPLDLFNATLGANLKAKGHSWAEAGDPVYTEAIPATCETAESVLYYCTNENCGGYVTKADYDEDQAWIIGDGHAEYDTLNNYAGENVGTDAETVNKELVLNPGELSQRTVVCATRIATKEDGDAALGHDFDFKDTTSTGELADPTAVHQHSGICQHAGCEYNDPANLKVEEFTKEQVRTLSDKFTIDKNEPATCATPEIQHYICNACGGDIPIASEDGPDTTNGHQWEISKKTFEGVEEGSYPHKEDAAHEKTCTVVGCPLEGEPQTETCTSFTEKTEMHKDPTCSHGEYDYFECDDCHQIYIQETGEPDENAHEWGWHLMQAANCTTPGFGRWECAVEAGENDEKVVLHQYVVIPGDHVLEDGVCERYYDLKHGDLMTEFDANPTYDDNPTSQDGKDTDEKVTYHYTCKRCGKDVTKEGKGKGHVFADVPDSTKNSTCVEPGLKTWVCQNGKNCSGVVEGIDADLINDASGVNEDGIAIKTEEIGATGKHNLVEVPAKAADCFEDGNIECKQCTVCKKYFATDGIQELTDDSWKEKSSGHQFGDVTPATEADCGTKKDGNDAYKQCTECELYYAADAEVTAPKGAGHEYASDFTHKYEHAMEEHPAQDPDCGKEKEGNLNYWYCSKCEKYFKDADGSEEYEPDGWKVPYAHDFTGPSELPNCMHGYYPATCKKCGEPQMEVPGTKSYNLHSYNDRKEDGNFYNNMPALSRDDKEHYTPATCEEDGYWTFVCDNDGCAEAPEYTGVTTVEAEKMIPTSMPTEYKHTLKVIDKDSHLNAKHSFKDGKCQVCGTALPTEVDAPTAQLQEDKTMLIDANFGDIKSQLDESYEICQYGIYFAIKNDASNEETVKTEVINAVTEVEDKASITDLAKQAFLNIKPEELEKGTILENTVHIVSGKTAYDGAKHKLTVKEESHAKSVYARGYMVLKNKNDGTYSFIYTKVLRTSYNELAGE